MIVDGKGDIRDDRRSEDKDRRTGKRRKKKDSTRAEIGIERRGDDRRQKDRRQNP